MTPAKVFLCPLMNRAIRLVAVLGYTHRYIIEIPNFAAIVVVHGVQNSVPSAFIGNAERRPFIIAKNALNVYTQRRSLFTRRTPGRRVEAT